METTIKQAEEERTRALQESKRLLKDYQPIKEQINKIRDMLHLDKLSDNDEDDTALITMQYDSVCDIEFIVTLSYIMTISDY
jgi:hypothetical protein